FLDHVALLYLSCSVLLRYDYFPPAHLSTLSLHDALPISHHGADGLSADALRPGRLDNPIPDTIRGHALPGRIVAADGPRQCGRRSEEHTSELQSRENLVCRLLLEKKKRIEIVLCHCLLR